MTERFDTDVVVVGGGFSGVAAARELANAGYAVTLLEARDRLGGLTHSTMFSGHLVELGGTWIHWFQPHVWAEVGRYGLEVDESPSPDHVIFVNSDGRREGSVWEVLGPMAGAVDRFCAASRSLYDRPYEPFRHAADVAVKDALSIEQRLVGETFTSAERDLLSALVTPLTGARLSDAGALILLHEFALSGCDFASFIATAATYKLAKGTGALIAAMIADSAATVRLGCPVVAVSHTQDSVTVGAADGTKLKARAAVLTVPLNTLGSIAFSPAVAPAKAQAAAEGQPSNGVKLWIRSPAEVAPFLGLAPNDMPISFIRPEYHDEAGTLLVAVSRGPDALDPSDYAAVESALRQFVPGATVAEVLHHPWDADPYSRGTWPVFGPGQRTRFQRALQEPQGRLFFGGGQTANGWNAFIDGAIESGLRAAREVKAALPS